jgi:hypothetical protein
MSNNSGCTGIPRKKARKMSKKMPFSGQKKVKKDRRISSSGMLEDYLTQK